MIIPQVDLDRNPAMLTSYVTLLLPLAQQNFGLFTFSVVELKYAVLQNSSKE